MSARTATLASGLEVGYVPAARMMKPISQSGTKTRKEAYPGRSPALVYKSTIRELGAVCMRRISHGATDRGKDV